MRRAAVSIIALASLALLIALGLRLHRRVSPDAPPIFRPRPEGGVTLHPPLPPRPPPPMPRADEEPASMPYATED